MHALARHCFRHEDRAAIGVCVVTGRAICAECSTQYRGVNYSKEGLAQFLAEQRSRSGAGRPALWVLIILVLASPLAVYMSWLSLETVGQLLVDMMQAGDREGVWR